MDCNALEHSGKETGEKEISFASPLEGHSIRIKVPDSRGLKHGIYMMAMSAPYSSENYMPDLVIIDIMTMNASRLKYAQQSSALLAGFSISVLVQMNLTSGISDGMWILFGLMTSTVVAVHLFAVLVSICLLPHIEAYNKLNFWKVKEGHQINFKMSPHTKFRGYITAAWNASTVVGIVLFLAEVIVVGWVHLSLYSMNTAYAITAFISPLMLLFVLFAWDFHVSVLEYQLALRDDALQDAQRRLHLGSRVYDVPSGTVSDSEDN